MKNCVSVIVFAYSQLYVFVAFSDIEKKATLDQVFRDELTRLIVSHSKYPLCCECNIHACSFIFFGVGPN